MYKIGKKEAIKEKINVAQGYKSKKLTLGGL